MKIAIIGSGISGLSSALLLSQKHNITLFEINKRFGGHANTVDIMYKQSLIPVDTGFIVYNKLNYPNLIGFFDFFENRNNKFRYVLCCFSKGWTIRVFWIYDRNICSKKKFI